MVKVVIKSLKGQRLITLTHKYIQVTGFKVNPNSPSSPKFHGILCKRLIMLSCLNTTPRLSVWD